MGWGGTSGEDLSGVGEFVGFEEELAHFLYLKTRLGSLLLQDLLNCAHMT